MLYKNKCLTCTNSHKKQYTPQYYALARPLLSCSKITSTIALSLWILTQELKIKNGHSLPEKTLFGYEGNLQGISELNDGKKTEEIAALTLMDRMILIDETMHY